MTEQLIRAFWGTSLRKTITAICALIASMCGAVVAVPPAWEALGLPEIATRSWARTAIEKPIKHTQNTVTRQVIDLQLDIATGKLDQLDNNRTSLEIEKLKAPDDQIKAKVDLQIRKIDRDTQTINDQIKTLRGLISNPPL